MQKSVSNIPPQGGPETILLAEDNEAVRNLESQFLEEFGYKVILAVDGYEVIDRFREHVGEVALIILDLIMPRRSGREAAEELRKLQPGVKILFSSGYPADFIEGHEILAEGEAFIEKPVRPLDLLRMVRRMLDRP